jgi:hypothetical protein
VESLSAFTDFSAGSLAISDLQRFSPDWTDTFARAGAARRREAADRRIREETRVILISVLAVRERGLAPTRQCQVDAVK